MKRTQFTFYESFYLSLKKLPMRERVKVYDSICELALYGNENTIESVAGAVFEIIKPIIKSGTNKALNRLGTKTNEEQNDNKPKTNREQEKEKEEEKEKEKVKEQYVKENTKRKFTKPTREEVIAYCKERGNDVDTNRFYDFYESKGWKVGKEPMKDWKAAVRTWERSSKTEQPKPTPKPSPYIAPQQKVDNSDIERMRRLIAEMKGETSA